MDRRRCELPRLRFRHQPNAIGRRRKHESRTRLLKPLARTIQQSIPNLTRADGTLRPFGTYRDIIAKTTSLETARRTQRKTWLYVGVFHPKLYTGFAIVDAGYAANAFAYVYLPDEKRFLEHKTIRPWGFDASFDPELESNWSLGDFSIQRAENVTRATCLSSKFELDLEIEHNPAGLSSICPAGARPYNFTYKNLGMRASAVVRIDNQSFDVDGPIGSVDFSKGYPPRETIWRWASVVGKLEDGTPFAANLVADHNNDLENAYWIDGEPHLLGPANFSFDPQAPMSVPWEITTDCGRLNMLFSPLSGRAEKINAVVVRHDFAQPCGFFEGFLKHDGESRRFTGHGVTETHRSIW